MKFFILFCLTSLLPTLLRAQVVTLKGITVKISSGLQVKVNGDVKSGSGSTIDTDGTLTIAGSFSNIGTAKGSGTISYTGNLTNTGIVAPGNNPTLGILSIIGNYQNGTGTLKINLGGASTPGVSYDQLAVNGSAILSGALDVSLINSFSIVPGQIFTILTANNIVGTFATTNLPNGVTVQYNATSVQLVSCIQIMAETTSAVATGVLGPGNCTVYLMSTGIGNSFVYQNTSKGFVYSSVYRQGGSYILPPVPVKKPGTYTFTAYYTNACGQTTSASRTVEVGGTGCQ